MKSMKYLVTGFLATSLLSLSVQGAFAQNYSYTTPATPARTQLQGRVTMIPMGTTFAAVTTSDISSNNLVIGDNVTLTLASPFYYKGCLIAPANSNIIGLVTDAKPAGRVESTGRIKIKFTEIITPNGNRLPVSAKIITNDGTGVLKGQATKDKAKSIAKDVAIGSAGGALSGLVFGSMAGGSAGKGTALGTALGAGLGLGKAIIDKGQDVTIPAGSQLNLMIDQPSTVNY